MSYEILSDMVAGISEFKKNPVATIESAEGMPLAILSHNKPVCYCIAPELYELMLDALGDIDLAKLIKERKGMQEIKVDINDL